MSDLGSRGGKTGLGSEATSMGNLSVVHIGSQRNAQTFSRKEGKDPSINCVCGFSTSVVHLWLTPYCSESQVPHLLKGVFSSVQSLSRVQRFVTP